MDGMGYVPTQYFMDFEGQIYSNLQICIGFYGSNMGNSKSYSR